MMYSHKYMPSSQALDEALDEGHVHFLKVPIITMFPVDANLGYLAVLLHV